MLYESRVAPRGPGKFGLFMYLCDWKGCLVVDVEPCGSSVCNVCIQDFSLFCRPIMSAVGNWVFFGVIFAWLMMCPGRLLCLVTASSLLLLMLNLCVLQRLRSVCDASHLFIKDPFHLAFSSHVSFFYQRFHIRIRCKSKNLFSISEFFFLYRY